MAQNVVTCGGNQPRGVASFVQFGISRRRSVFQAAHGVFFAPLPDDPIGTTTVTFDGVVAGSSVQIESQDGSTVLHYGTAPGGSFDIALPVYASGSPLNAWRIKVRKGTSAPTYQPYETLMTATVGSSSIYINQLPD